VEMDPACGGGNQADLAVARLLDVLESGREYTPDLALSDPAAGVLPLEQLPLDEPAAAAARRLFGEDPVLSWGEPRPPVQASSRSVATRPAWWLASLAPPDGGWLERDGSALRAMQSGTAARRLSAGVVRP